MSTLSQMIDVLIACANGIASAEIADIDCSPILGLCTYHAQYVP